MRQDALRPELTDRLEFVKSQIRSAERAFMGGGFVHATHDELDRFQIAYAAHPLVLGTIKEVRASISDYLKAKINGRLVGEDGNHHPVVVWHSYNRMEQAIRSVSVGVGQRNRETVAA